jgi:hypothetical protein
MGLFHAKTNKVLKEVRFEKRLSSIILSLLRGEKVERAAEPFSQLDISPPSHFVNLQPCFE